MGQGMNMSRAKNLVLVLVAGLFAMPALAQQSAAVADSQFGAWLQDFREEARANGISDATLLALDGLEPLPRVIELDNSQPELLQTFTRYTELRITPAQITRGQALMQEHREVLKAVEERYGIAPNYLVSFWAIETSFGRITGGFPALQALLTLAYDQRRAAQFRQELLIALQIIDAGHITPAQMTGSWAGAMGHLQFMPSTFMRFAVDGDGDGKIDIWNSLPDIFHSAGNYVSNLGWQRGERWGREVLLPETFDYSLADPTILKPLQQWRALGIKTVDGNALPAGTLDAGIVVPAGVKGPAFLVYDNYRAALGYNSPAFYGLTVGLLADRLAGGSPVQRMPDDEQALSAAELRELQESLNAQGYDAGVPDGRMGSRTRQALRAFQQKMALPMDAYASPSMLEMLRASR
jgi:membrane-bound lytic murein transglycosylase B